MDKVKGITIIITAIASVIVTIIVANKLLDTTGEVNQGNFRISDIVVMSTAELVEVQDNETVDMKKLSDFVYDISQTNEVSILIDSNIEATQMYIDNLTVSNPVLKGNMNICQRDYKKYDITAELKRIDLELEKENDKYRINLCIDNDDVITDKSVSDDIEEIVYDASIFRYLNVDVSTLKFNVSFDLNIVDVTGKTVRTTIMLNMPTDETLTEGMSILKQDVSKYIFTIIEN
ncbi:MAG: hypothetical protein J6A15_09470 [Clostridia bacterium]|nr:hypothetical protein [Clostridia bacterium]